VGRGVRVERVGFRLVLRLYEYIMLDFKSYVVKMMSKSVSQYLVRFQGK
jgi:hypothetical protein